MNEQAEALDTEDLPMVDDEPTEDTEEPEEEVSEVDDSEEEPEESEDSDEESDDESEDDSEEYEEVEIDGQTYTLPKSIKDKVMMQADYTRKTQEVAEQRKQLEQLQKHTQEQQELQQRHFKQYAQLSQIDEQLQQYDQVDWQRLHREQPEEASQHQARYMQLQSQKNRVAQEINQLEQERQLKTQQETAQRVEQGRKQLEQMVKGWSSDEAKKVDQYMQDLGVSNQVREALHYCRVPEAPQIIAALHKAMQYDQTQKKAAAKKKPQGKPVKPTKKVSGKAKPKPNIYSDKLTPEQRIALFQKQKSKSP